MKFSKKGKKPFKYTHLKKEHKGRKNHIHKAPALIFSILSKYYYPTQLSTNFNPEHTAGNTEQKRRTKREASKTGTWTISSVFPPHTLF